MVGVATGTVKKRPSKPLAHVGSRLRQHWQNARFRYCYLVEPSNNILGWKSGSGRSRRRFFCPYLGARAKNRVGTSCTFVFSMYKHRFVRIMRVELRVEEEEDIFEDCM